jgi:hypothetical protein
MASGPDRSAQFGVQRVDGIRRVQNPPHIAGEGIERGDLAPGTSPALADRRVLPAPGAILEGSERSFAGVALFLGAALLCLGVPFIIGITSDLLARPGAPLILALGSGAAIVIWRALKQAMGHAPTSKSLG